MGEQQTQRVIGANTVSGRGFVVRVVAVLAVLAGALVTVSAAPVSAQVVPHTSLVPETAEAGFPRILKTPARPVREGGNREVYAAEQVGRFLVSGGDFLNVELTNGTVVDQQYFAAFNIDSKQPVCFGQLSFDNEVLAVEPGPTPTQVYVGGRFLNVTGADGVNRFRARVALVDLADCSVDPNFVVTGTTAKINEIEYTGDRLFVGGDFASIGGVDQAKLAELDPTTGIVDPEFRLTFVGGTWTPIRGMGVNPAADRLIIGGRFGDVTDNFGNQLTNSATAVFDITAPAPQLTGHRWVSPTTVNKMQDISISPDGTQIGAAFGAATSADYAYLVPATETEVDATWRHYMRDSNFGIAVANNAVYVGGHFCYIDEGPGTTDEMSPKLGLDRCTGTQNRFGPGAWRTQIAALSLEDGTPLTWNPGSDAFRGIGEMTVTSRGLLIGHDGEFLGGRDTGTLAFLDFGPLNEDTTPPSNVTILTPDNNASVTNPTLITGQATDDTGVDDFRIALQATNGQWVQPDATLGPDRYGFRAPADQNGQFTISITMPAGDYTLEARAADAAGNLSPNITRTNITQTGIEGSPPIIEAVDGQQAVQGTAIEPVQIAATDPDGDALTFDAVGLPDGVSIDALGLITGTPTTFGDFTTTITVTDDRGASAQTTFGWVVTEEGVEPPAPCRVTSRVGTTVTVEWDAVDDQRGSYNIRINDAWRASIPADTLTWTGTAPTDSLIELRARPNWQITDIECQDDFEPEPEPDDPTCTVTDRNNGQITVTWTPVPGEEAPNGTYQVRIDGRWIQTINAANDLTWTGPINDGETVEIRSRQGDILTDVTCV